MLDRTADQRDRISSLSRESLDSPRESRCNVCIMHAPRTCYDIFRDGGRTLPSAFRISDTGKLTSRSSPPALSILAPPLIAAAARYIGITRLAFPIYTLPFEGFDASCLGNPKYFVGGLHRWNLIEDVYNFEKRYSLRCVCILDFWRMLCHTHARGMRRYSTLWEILQNESPECAYPLSYIPPTRILLRARDLQLLLLLWLVCFIRRLSISTRTYSEIPSYRWWNNSVIYVVTYWRVIDARRVPGNFPRVLSRWLSNSARIASTSILIFPIPYFAGKSSAREVKAQSG